MSICLPACLVNVTGLGLMLRLHFVSGRPADGFARLLHDRLLCVDT